MENTIPTTEQPLNQLSEIDRKNLELLYKLGEHTQNFKPHAKSLNEVFYLYVHTCLFTQEQIQITNDDVYNVLEIVKVLNELQFPKN
ncbi:hypothetical protein ACTS9E_14525 [Empedobacter brevis]